MKIPDDLVLVGHITGAYGINGWVRIRPYSANADAMTHARTWWLDKPDMHDVEVMQAKTHGGDVVAQIMGVADRNAAEAMKGRCVHVARSHFPVLDDDEYYWIDLIGLEVINLEGQRLGTVLDLMDNGAHPILRVGLEASEQQPKPIEMLIPFIDQIVKSVNQQEKVITADWGLDYS